MKIIVLAALALSIAAPALAQTSPNGGIGSLTPPAPTPDQAQGPHHHLRWGFHMLESSVLEEVRVEQHPEHRADVIV